MKKTFPILSLAAAAALAAFLPGCSTNTQGEDAAPVFLTGSFDVLPAAKSVSSGSALAFNTTTLRNRLKTTGVSSLTFLDVQCEIYLVSWTRLNGGTVASPSEQFGCPIIVPANGASTLTNYEYMTASNLIKPPLDQLFPFNGGIDHETGKSEIDQMGHVKWYGHTLSGQPVESVEATFNMVFFYGGSAGRVEGRLVR